MPAQAPTQDGLYHEAAETFGAALARFASAYEADPEARRDLLQEIHIALWRSFAGVEAGIKQFVYLVLFSYAFFFKGYTGLAITIGAIITLFVVMQMTGRIRWADKFTPPPK
jgi:hypothetical protein